MEKKSAPKRISSVIIIPVIAVILAASLFVVLNLGQVFAKEILGELVERQTNGFYSLVFDDLRVRLLDREIEVKQMYLQADSSKISSETGLKTVYEIELSNLTIKINSLYKFYFQKKLEIESLHITDPEIQMQRIGESNPTSFSLETGNLYKAISDYLTVLKIDYFRIQDGQYNTGDFSLGNIDFQVQNLLLDSVARNDVFYSERIFLEIQNQKFYLPDSIHQITFDKFLLSTEDSVLRFENLAIRPTEKSGVRFEDNNSVNVYDIRIQSLALKGVDYQAAYRNDHLIIDELSFEQPIIYVDDESHGKIEKKKSDNSILDLLFTVFHKIDIGELRIADSELDLKINTQETYQRIQSEETSISFTNISLDTLNYRFNRRTNYFDHVEIHIRNYDYILPDSLHEIAFDSLSISSLDSTLSVNNLSISGVEAQNQNATILLQIPSLELNGLVYEELMNKNLMVNSFILDEMDLQLKPEGKSEDSTSIKDLGGLYEVISPYFNVVDINQFTINQVRFGLLDHLQIEEASINLDGLSLNATTQNLTDLFERSSVSVRDIYFNQDSIQFSGKGAELSKDLTELDLINWQILINTQQLSLDGSLDTLTIVDIHPDSLLRGNFMTFRKAMISSPDFDVRFISSANRSSSNLGIEKEIVINDGRFKIQTDAFATSVGSLDADLYLGDSIAIHDIQAVTIDVNAVSMNHELHLESMRYDTLLDQLSLTGIQVNPLNSNDSTQSMVRGDLQELRIDGFIQHRFFDHQELVANQVFIDNPNIQLHILANPEREPAENSNLTANIESIKLTNGDFALTGMGDGIKQVQLEDFNGHLFGLDYPESKALFYADSVKFSLTSISPDLSSEDLLSTGNLSFNSINQELNIKSIRYQQANGVFDLFIPKLEINELGIKDLMNGNVDANQLTVSSPLISIVRGANQKNEPNKAPELPIKLNDIKLYDIAVTLQDSVSGEYYEVNALDLHVEDVNYHGTFTLPGLLQHTNTLSLSGSSLQFPLNDFYSLETSDYSYDSDEKELILNEIHLNPTHSKTTYSNYLKQQTDWFDVGIDQLTLNGLDIMEIVTDSILRVEAMKMDGTDLYVYRDKRIPFPESQEGWLPHERVLGIPFPIQVDTIQLNGNVSYEEHPEDFETPGLLSFDNLNARIVHFSNMNLESNPIMQLHATGQLVNEGLFDVNARFELDQPDQRFTFQGRVEDLPMDSLNQMLGPVARVNIRSGIANEIDFQFVADDSLAVGEMVFLYKNLKLQVLNAKKHETNLGSGLMSFFANTFVIRNKNPRFLFPRKGTIYFKRDDSKAIFNYWGKSILSGAVSSVGIHKSDRQVKQDAREAKKRNKR